MQILSGHISAETAYLVEDYPYGFRLRCRIRYWLEFKPGKGARLWSQTSNPKAGHNGQIFNAASGLYSTIWNKPKASTFCRFGGVMFVNDKGHVGWDGVGEYMDCAALVAWRDAYGHTMPEDAQQTLKGWITRKLAYEQSKAEGLVKSTMTTTQYGCITDSNFGKPIAAPTVETEILKSDYTPEQLQSMGRTLRTPMAEQIARL